MYGGGHKKGGKDLENKNYQEITYKELLKLKDSPGYRLIDIRSLYEYEKNHIPGAISIPEYELAVRYKSFRKDLVYIFVCQKGKNSRNAALILAEEGYKTISLIDGMNGVM